MKSPGHVAKSDHRVGAGAELGVGGGVGKPKPDLKTQMPDTTALLMEEEKLTVTDEDAAIP